MAQSFNNNTSFRTYLKLIEKEYNVFFSYSDVLIEDIYLYENEIHESLDDKIDYLEKITPFAYIIQADKSILVVPKPNANKVCISVIDSVSTERLTNTSLLVDKLLYKPNKIGEYNILTTTSLITCDIYAQTHISNTFKIQFDSYEDSCYEARLMPYYEMLDEVILTRLLTRGIQKNISGDLEINYEEFGLLPGLIEPDVLQSIQAIPGITSRRESVSYLNVRGGTHDQNLFLWDGIKMYNTSVFFGMISAFNPYLTEKVKLVKNGTSAKYGDGVSSLIDMKTSNSVVDSLEIAAGINLINADILVDVPINKESSLELSSRQSINTIWESPTYNSYFDKVFQNTEVTNLNAEATDQDNDFSFFDATINYKYKLNDKDLIKTSLFYSEDSFGLNRFENHNGIIQTRKSDLEQVNIAGSVYYDKTWNSSTTTQIQFYISNYDQNAVNADLLSGQRLEQINEVNEYGIKINLQNKLSNIFKLESGYQLNETGIFNSQIVNDPGFISEVNNSILTNSLYSQLNYSSKNKLLNVNFGVRLNHFSKFDEFKLEPRFSLSYQFIDDLFLEILGEQKSQVTSQVIDLQTDFLGVENRRWVLSDPESRPVIESEQVSLGLNYVKKTWFINVDAFYKRVEGITTQGQGFQNQFEFSVNHGNYDIKGVDVLVNKNFDPISGWISYSFSENEYTFNNLSPSSFPSNLDIRHVVSTGISYEQNGFKLSTGFNWHSGSPTTIPLEEQEEQLQNIAYDLPNANRLQDYFRLDFSSTYKFAISSNINAMAGISVLNIFGNGNIFNQFYRIEDEKIRTFRQKGLGFTPNLMFRLNF